MPPKSSKVPYEIKNAREWSMDKNKPQYSSDEESSNEYEEPNDFIHERYISGGSFPQQMPAQDDTRDAQPSKVLFPRGNIASEVEDDGFQRVTHKKWSRPTIKPRKAAAKRDQSHRGLHLDYKRDNHARAAFRRRQAHDLTFRLPKDCSEIFPIARIMYEFLEELGVRHRTFIRPPQDTKDRDLRVWGSRVQVEKTVAEIRGYLEPRSKSVSIKPKGREYFARENSTIGSHWKAMQNHIKKQASIHEFQQHPEKGQVFNHTGSYLWPVEDVRPEELLGDSLEALDPIRFEYKCHIVLDNQVSAFKIFTDDPESVKKTMHRITGVMKEYVARTSRQIVDYLIEPPNYDVMRKEVKTLPGPMITPGMSGGKIPLLTGDMWVTEVRDNWLEESRKMREENVRRIEHDLRNAISILPYYRGKVRLRVQHGTFELTVLRWPKEMLSMPFPDFVKNLALPGTKGRMLRDLQIRKSGAAIIEKIHTATDLLEPMSHSVFALEDVIPSIDARFTFQDLDGPPFQLVVEMSPSSLDRIYEKTQVLWTRADGRDNSTLLSVFNIQLDEGSSWVLHAFTENTIDTSRVTPKMKEFADSVRLIKSAKAGFEPTGQRLFRWERDLPGTLRPTTFEQKTSYQYRMVHNTDIVFEIARYDVYADTEDENRTVHSSWAANLSNINWDSTLAGNSDLGLGQSAAWEPELSTFFPGYGTAADKGTDQGLFDFLNTVQKATNFIDDIKSEPPHLRK